MFSNRNYYLLKLQYLGFRYHGWQKQPNVKTVEHMVERTIKHIVKHDRFKLLASGRTDAKVSANTAFVELFMKDESIEPESFLCLLNENLPQDIRALKVSQVDASFNIMDAPSEKEYVYLFCFGKKSHPFAAPFMVNMIEDLDVKLMQQAASLFEGTHDFRAYTYKPNEKTNTVGTVISAFIEPNTLFTANFFPKESYIFRIRGKGFKRHQIRLMMGVLFDLGRGKCDLEFVKKTLEPDNTIKLEHIAKASGLILNNVIL